MTSGVSTNSALFTGALVLQRGLPFLALPVVARAVSQETFGVITLVTTVAAVGAVLASMGIGNAVPRLVYAEDATATRTTWAALVRVQLAVAAGVPVLVCGALALVETTSAADIAGYWYLAPYLAGCLSVQQLFQGLAVARGAAVRALSASAAQVALGVVVGPWLAFSYGAPAYLATLGAASLVAAAILSRPPGPRPLWRAEPIRDGLALAFPFVGQGLATWLLALSDRVILAAYFTLTDVGVYQVSYMVGSALGLVLEGVQQAWAPRYYRSTRPNKRAVLLGLVTPFVVVSVAAALLLALLAPPLLAVVVPGYRVDVAVLAIVALAGIPRATYFVLVADLLERRLTASIAFATACGAALAVGLDLLLLPLTGPWLAAVATVAAFTAQVLVVARRSLGAGWPGRCMRWVLAPLALGAVALAGVLAAQGAGGGSQILVALVVAAGFAVGVRRLMWTLREASAFWAGLHRTNGTFVQKDWTKVPFVRRMTAGHGAMLDGIGPAAAAGRAAGRPAAEPDSEPAAEPAAELASEPASEPASRRGRRIVGAALAFVPLWFAGLGFLWWPLVAGDELAHRVAPHRSPVARLLAVLGLTLAGSLLANALAGEVGAGRLAGAALAAVIWLATATLCVRWSFPGSRPYVALAIGVVGGAQGVVSGLAVLLHPSVLSALPTPASLALGERSDDLGVSVWLTLDLAYDDYFGGAIVRSAGMMGTAAWSAGFAALAAVVLVLYRVEVTALTGRRWVWPALAGLSLVSVYLSYARVTYVLAAAGLVAVAVGLGARRLFGAAAPLLLVPALTLAAAAVLAFAPDPGPLLESQDRLRPDSSDTRFSSYVQGVEAVVDGGPVAQTFGLGAKPFSESLGFGVGSESTYISLLVRGGGLALGLFVLCLGAAAAGCVRRADWAGGLVLALLAVHAAVEDLDVGTLTLLALVFVVAPDQNGRSLVSSRGSASGPSTSRSATRGTTVNAAAQPRAATTPSNDGSDRP